MAALSSAQSGEPLIVYYDGLCPFCIESMRRMERRDTAKRLRFRDLNEPASAAEAAPRFTPEDLLREMHVKMPDGTWRIGFYGWVAVIRVLPGLAWLAALMSLPLIADIGRVFYRWFAANRLTVSRVLGLPAPCDADGACRIGSHVAPVQTLAAVSSEEKQRA